MKRDELYKRTLAYFRQAMPTAESELHFGSVFQLVVAVVLSAQCTDKRVNMTTPALFAAYPTPQDMAAASEDEIYEYIKSVSYPRNKSHHLAGLARMIVDEYGGEVPRDMEGLQRLPGVGRKTANVVTAVAFDLPAMPVDTHVFRVSHRLGLSDGKTPQAVEKDLERHIPVAERAISHHWLILHGRYTCIARNPKCGDCPLSAWCRFYSVSKEASV